MACKTIIAGVGPGLGAALARRFSEKDCSVALFARTKRYVEALTRELCQEGRDAIGLSVDLGQPAQVTRAFKEVHRRWGRIDNLIYNASVSAWKGLLQLDPKDFEAAWRASVLGAFLCSRQAAQDMLLRRAGAILFTGATSSVRGRKGALDFSSAKFGLRGLADSLARELWPKGVHVAHVVVDGMIDTPRVRRKYRPKRTEPLLQPESIAEAYWNLANQKPDAWTFELDLRPAREEFLT